MTDNIDQLFDSLRAPPADPFLALRQEANGGSPGETLASFRDEYVATGDRDRQRYWGSRIPVVGAFAEFGYRRELNQTIERIRTNTADYRDYQRVGRHLADEQLSGNRGILGSAADIAASIPGFGAEIALTGGIAGLGRTAAGRVISGTGRAATAGRVVAGEAVRAAVMPSLASNIAREQTPSVQVDGSNINIGEARSFWQALPRGYYDTFVETLTEQLGGSAAFQAASGAVGRAGSGVLRRIGLEGATEAVQRGILARVPGGASRLARGMGWNGLVSEYLEERAGEVMRGVGGQAGLGGDFGSLGDLAQGNVGAFLRQSLIEGLAFGLAGTGHRVLGNITQPNTMPRQGSREFNFAREVLATNIFLADSQGPEASAAARQQFQGEMEHYGLTDDNLEQFVPQGTIQDPPAILSQEAQGPEPGVDTPQTTQTPSDAPPTSETTSQDAPGRVSLRKGGHVFDVIFTVNDKGEYILPARVLGASVEANTAAGESVGRSDLDSQESRALHSDEVARSVGSHGSENLPTFREQIITDEQLTHRADVSSSGAKRNSGTLEARKSLAAQAVAEFLVRPTGIKGKKVPTVGTRQTSGSRGNHGEIISQPEATGRTIVGEGEFRSLAPGRVGPEPLGPDTPLNLGRIGTPGAAKYKQPQITYVPPDGRRAEVVSPAELARTQVTTLLDGAGLTGQERFLVEAFLNDSDGRSLTELADDPAMQKRTGGAYSKQRLKQIGDSAARKIGLPAGMTLDGFRQEYRVHAARSLIEAGQASELTGMRLTEEEAREVTRRTRETDDEYGARYEGIEDIADQFLQEAENGTLTEAKRREFIQTTAETHQGNQARAAGEAGSQELSEERGVQTDRPSEEASKSASVSKAERERRHNARLRTIIRSRGGINRKKLGRDWNVSEDFVQSGMLGLLQKDATMGLDEWADTLAGEGHLPQGADDAILMDKLKADAVSQLYQYEAELRDAEREYHEAQAAQEPSGASAERAGQDQEGAEQLAGEEEAKAEETASVGDAYEPPGITTPDFDPITFGRPVTEAEQRTLPGGGQATAGETQLPPRVTALANAQVDKERAANGLPPLMSEARKANAEVWDEAMAKLDADPQLAARLVDELSRNPRATTVEENALLLHRKVALANEHRRAMLDYIDARKPPREQRDQARLIETERRERELFQLLDQLDKVARRTGTEWGKAGQFRRQLAKEDFSLSSMLMRAETAKGSPLTEEERIKITELQQEIERLQKLLLEKASADARIDLARAEKKYADMLRKYHFDNLSLPQKIFQRTMDVWDASRAIITAFDLSYFLRQGGVYTFAHPIKSAKAFAETIGAFASERAAERAADAIKQRANAALYEEAGLYLAETDASLSGQEEAFMGRVVAKIPGVAGSQRAYTTFLNRIRVDWFDSLVGTLGANGQVSKEEAKAIANFINVATGRGSLGSAERMAVQLSRVFFSPRYVASRFQLLAGTPLYGGTAQSRLRIAGEYGRALAGLALIYGIFKLAWPDDTEITFDPRSTDFGKIKIGNARIDPLMGLSQNAVFIARLVSGQSRSTTTGLVAPIRGEVPFGGQTVSDVIGRFIRSKLAPVPGALTDFLTGTDYAGQPVSPAGVARNLVTPISVRDTWEAMNSLGIPRGTGVSLLAILGMGSQVYQPRRGHQLVDDYYNRLRGLEGERQTFTRRGVRFPQEREYQTLHSVESRMQEIARRLRGERIVNGRLVPGTAPSEAEKKRLTDLQLQLAQRAMDALARLRQPAR